MIILANMQCVSHAKRACGNGEVKKGTYTLLKVVVEAA